MSCPLREQLSWLVKNPSVIMERHLVHVQSGLLLLCTHSDKIPRQYVVHIVIPRLILFFVLVYLIQRIFSIRSSLFLLILIYLSGWVVDLSLYQICSNALYLQNYSQHFEPFYGSQIAFDILVHTFTVLFKYSIHVTCFDLPCSNPYKESNFLSSLI